MKKLYIDKKLIKKIQKYLVDNPERSYEIRVKLNWYINGAELANKNIKNKSKYEQFNSIFLTGEYCLKKILEEG